MTTPQWNVSQLEAALADFSTPGLAVAVVKHDDLIFAQGFGQRGLDVAAPVNEQTLSAIGSISKSFTAAALALLVDEGRLAVTLKKVSRFFGH